MEPQTIINVGAGTALAVVGWLARQLWDAVKSLREDLQRLQIDLPQHYVAKSDWTQAWQEISRKLDKIADKLDGKVDK